MLVIRNIDLQQSYKRVVLMTLLAATITIQLASKVKISSLKIKHNDKGNAKLDSCRSTSLFQSKDASKADDPEVAQIINENKLRSSLCENKEMQVNEKIANIKITNKKINNARLNSFCMSLF